MKLVHQKVTMSVLRFIANDYHFEKMHAYIESCKVDEEIQSFKKLLLSFFSCK